MVKSFSGLQFRLQHLLVLVMASCIVLAAISDEPLNIAVATIFFCVSSIAVSTLVWMSTKNLFEVVSRSIRTRRLGHLSRRFKWLMVDVTIATWIVVAVAAANFVLENHQAHADSAIMASLIGGPAIVVGVARLNRRVQPGRVDSVESSEKVA